MLSTSSAVLNAASIAFLNFGSGVGTAIGAVDAGAVDAGAVDVGAVDVDDFT